MPRIVFEPRFDAWRDEARRLIADAVAPQRVDWVPSTGEHQESLFGGVAPPKPPSAPAGPAPSGSTPRVPKGFVRLAREVSYHRDDARWSLLYRVLWRLTRGGERSLLKIDVDSDVLAMRSMEKAVRRDAHKMKAFVRFRKVPADDGDPWFIA